MNAQAPMPQDPQVIVSNGFGRFILACSGRSGLPRRVGGLYYGSLSGGEAGPHDARHRAGPLSLLSAFEFVCIEASFEALYDN